VSFPVVVWQYRKAFPDRAFAAIPLLGCTLRITVDSCSVLDKAADRVNPVLESAVPAPPANPRLNLVVSTPWESFVWP